MAAGMKRQVCVLGGGVIGLSVATYLLESFSEHIAVTIIADKFTPMTMASDKAGSIVLPSMDPEELGGNYPEWVKGSIKRFHRLYQYESNTGITHLPGHYIKPDTYKGCRAWFQNLLPSYHEVTNSPDKKILPGFDSKELINCSTFIIDPTQYMEYLIKRIILMGGVLVTQRIDNVSSLNSYHAIINCTGLAAREIASDPNVYPMKGVLLSVKAPWVKQWVLCGGISEQNRVFIFPRYNDEVILGVFNEENVQDSLLNEKETQIMIDNCVSVVPSLAGAKVTRKWCGIRPMRKGGVRLERDETMVNGSVVVHNYGHGAEGVMSSWGCAEEVGNIIGQSFGLNKKLYSKL